jgi:hypothetical protein
MTNKIAYYAMAVGIAVVMAAGMVVGTPGAVLANNEGAGYGTFDSYSSSESEMTVEQSYAGEIREPLETGALPHGSMTGDPEGWVNISAAEQDSSPELWGRPNVQSGGGGE